MQRPVRETLLVGREEGTAERFLLRAVGASVVTLVVLTAGWPLRERVAGALGVAFTAAYLLGVAALAGRHAYRNDGLLVTLAGTFVALLGYGVFVGLTFVLCLGSGGCPTLAEKVSYGVFVAGGVALPLGSVAFLAGVGCRRRRGGPDPSSGRDSDRPPG